MTEQEQPPLSIETAEVELRGINARVAQIQLRLSIIGSTVRAKRLEPRYYRELCDEQVLLRSEEADLRKAAADKKLEIGALRLGKQDQQQASGPKPDRLATTNEILEEILSELRTLNGRLALTFEERGESCP